MRARLPSQWPLDSSCRCTAKRPARRRTWLSDHGGPGRICSFFTQLIVSGRVRTATCSHSLLWLLYLLQYCRSLLHVNWSSCDVPRCFRARCWYSMISIACAARIPPRRECPSSGRACVAVHQSSSLSLSCLRNGAPPAGETCEEWAGCSISNLRMPCIISDNSGLYQVFVQRISPQMTSEYSQLTTTHDVSRYDLFMRIISIVMLS